MIIKTCWAIDIDHCAEPGSKPGTNANAVGICGPRGCVKPFEAIIADPLSKRFRMTDDDGTVVYEGAVLGPDEFAPLDDFGGPNYGCTGIEILENGRWYPL